LLCGFACCQFSVDKAECIAVDPQTGRTTYKEKLRPTPAHEQALADVLRRRRALCNASLKLRITAFNRRHIPVSRFEQEAEPKAVLQNFPLYAEASNVFGSCFNEESCT
jgi:hypothetical protein